MNKDITTTGENGGNVAKSEAEMYGSLILRAQKGDLKALSRLERNGVTLEAAKGQPFNAAVYLQEKLLGELGSSDRVFREGMRKNVTQMRSDICRPDASPEEEILAEVVILDRIYYMNLMDRYGLGSGLLTGKQDDLFRKQIDHAHRLLLRSTKELARVKRLIPSPSIQVNLANKQIVKNA